jgi:hypothetical protein
MEQPPGGEAADAYRHVGGTETLASTPARLNWPRWQKE